VLHHADKQSGPTAMDASGQYFLDVVTFKAALNAL
jgi:hypothetical protein